MRGQASIELIVVLAVALVVLAAMVFSGNEQLRGLRASSELAKANIATTSLSSAADSVSSQGVGSREIIRIDLPESLSASGSFIKGKLVNIAVYTGDTVSDVNSKSAASLSGSLPKSGGVHLMRIESRQGFVEISEVG